MESLTSEQQAVVDAIRSGPRGPSASIQGPFEVLLRAPELAMPTQELGAYLASSSSLPARLRELAVILTARRWCAQFQWKLHRGLAEAAGLEPSVVNAIATGELPTLDDESRAVYDFTSALLTDGFVADEEWSAVVSRWGKRGAIDLIGTVGYSTLMSFVVNVDRCPTTDGSVPLESLR